MILNASLFPPDPDADSISRQGIEDKLVEEYRNCHCFQQIKTELGGYTKFTVFKASKLPNLLHRTERIPS